VNGRTIEALAKANRIAFEGLAAPRRPASRNPPGNDEEVVANAGQQEAIKKRADLGQKRGFEKALANMRELAEMATKSQKEAFDVVRKRIEENVEGIRNLGKKSWQVTAFREAGHIARRAAPPFDNQSKSKVGCLFQIGRLFLRGT